MRFLVLGPLQVVQAGGEPLAIAGSKERTILACLVARAGRVVPVDDLIEELWGDHPPRAPEKTLVTYVSRLRRDLQSRRSAGSNVDVIVFRADGYTLESDGHEIDASLRAARGRRTSTPRYRAPCRGRPSARRGARSVARPRLPGLPVHGFGAAEGERLDELRRTATEDLIDSKLAGADPGQLVPELEAMVREEPVRERRWGR
jgi:DNA-binding transcriptional activator of the SARP family